MALCKGSWIIMALVAPVILPQTADAFSVVNRMVPQMGRPGEPNCKQETVSVQTQLNYRADSAQALMKYYNEDKQRVQEVAKKNGVTARIQSENYNINTANDYQFSRDGNLMFTLNGNAGYVVEPKEKAKDFFVALTADKIHGSMNYSMNDNCNRN